MKILPFSFCFTLVSLFLSVQAQDTTYQLPEINIYANTTLNLQTIQGLRPQNFPSPQSDIGTMLRSMPNSAGIRRGGSAIDPVYRGFRNNQLLITTNTGLTIEGGCPNRMDPTTSHIDAEEVQYLRWETGSNMLLYGQAIGGVLVMEIAEPKQRTQWGFNGKIQSGFESNYNGFSNSISLNGGNKRVFFSLSAGNKSYGNYTDGRDSIIKSSFQKDFVTAKIGVALTANQQLLFSYTRSESRAVRFPALPMDERFDYTDILNLSYLFYDDFKNEDLRINAYHVRVDHKMDNFDRPQANQIVPPSTGIMRAESVVDAITSGVNVKKRIHFNLFKGFVGGDFHQIEKDGSRTRNMIMTMGNLTTTSTKYDNLWKDAVIRNIGIYGQLSYPFKSIRSLVTATLRFDQHQHFSADTFNLVKNEVDYFVKGTHNNPLFSFGMRYDYKPTQNVLLSMDAVSAKRSPNMNELYIKRMTVGFDNYDYLGNPNLNPESNNQLTLSARLSGKKGILGVNIFVSQVSDYIGGVLLPSSVITAATQGSLGVKQYSNLGVAHFYGGELVLNSTPKKGFEFGATAGYTYAVLEKAIRYEITNNQVVGITFISNDPMAEMPAMNTSAWAIYKISSLNLSPRLSLEYTLPQNAISTANYEEATPDYLLINASVKYSFKNWATLDVGVNNILNQAYYNHLNRRVVASNPLEKIKLHEPGRVFFVNLKLEF